MKKIFVLLLFSLAALCSEAQSGENCEFTLTCRHGTRGFKLNLQSISGDCTEDDMQGRFESASVSKPLEIKKDWYIFTDHIVKTQSSICKDEVKNRDFAAYEVNGNKALLFLKSSGRPGYAYVNAILLNTLTGQVLDFKQLGQSKNKFIAILKTKKGFRLRLVKDTLSITSNVTCDCDAAFIDDWIEVSVTQDKLKSSWLK